MSATHAMGAGQRLRARWSGWSRPKKASVVLLATLLVGTAVAAAVLMMRGSITGGAQVNGTPAVEWSTAAPDAPTATAATGDGVTCLASVNGSGVLNVQLNNAYPGSTCEVQATLITSSGNPLKVQGLTFNTGAVEASYKVGCGASFSQGNPTRVTMQFVIKAGTAAGSYPASGDAGALVVFSGDYNAASCPVPTP